MFKINICTFAIDKRKTMVMADTDIWKKFSYDLIELKKNNVDEAAYHDKIETQFQFLGWAKYDGEINHKLSIPIGNHNSIQPDITIGKQPDWKFVVEVKKPSHSCQNKDIAQLTSYMRQLKLDVGLYIGEDIEVFYDTADAKENAKCVYSVDLKLEKNPKGEKFVELFSKQNFSKEAVARFCEDCIKAQEKKDSLERIKSDLMSSEGSAEIKAYVLSGLQDKYSDQFSSEELDSMLKGLTFTASDCVLRSKDVITKTRKDKNSKKTSNSKTNIKIKIVRSNLNAVGIFDGKGVTVLSGSPIAENSVKSYDKKEWREEFIKKHAHRVEGKLVMAEDVYFNSPSGASSFCLGSSSNGMKDWVDDDGNRLRVYLQ